MELILNAICKDEKLAFFNQFDLRKYCIEQDGIEQIVSIKGASKTSLKQKMFNYLHGPLLAAAVIGYARAGSNGIDKVHALYKLKAEFAKGVTYNHKLNKEEYYPLELSKMNKQELLKFITDCCYYIEINLEMEIPDSQQWKNFKLTGKNFKTVKTIKNQ